MTGEEHKDSMIITRVAYIMSKHLSLEEFQSLWFNSIFILPENPSFYDCEYAILSTAKSMGLDSNKQAEILNSFTQIGFPKIEIISISEEDENKTNVTEIEEQEVDEYTLKKTDLTQYLEKDISNAINELELVQLKEYNVTLGTLVNIEGYYSKSELGSQVIIGDSDKDGKVDYLENSLDLGGDSFRIYTLVYNSNTEKIKERLDYIGYQNIVENPTENHILDKKIKYKYKYELNNGYDILLEENSSRKELTSSILLMKRNRETSSTESTENELKVGNNTVKYGTYKDTDFGEILVLKENGICNVYGKECTYKIDSYNFSQSEVDSYETAIIINYENSMMGLRAIEDKLIGSGPGEVFEYIGN